MLKAADLFCGAGGTSIGAEQSGAATVRFAVNHWDIAVKTHAANFPHATHVNSRLDQVRPSECGKIDLLFASPECTHHSRARGGRPTSDQQRAGAWDLMPWIEHHRPTWMVVENVMEFEDWGPVGDDGRPLKRFRGRFFAAWVEAVRSAGYVVDWRRLNAADYGAATSRVRLFTIARKGNRQVPWPDPSHAKVERLVREAALFQETRQPWRGAWEVIDWSLPCPSLFSRSRPLADKTLLRIEAGLRRFVGPFVTRLRNHGDAADLQGPLGTITAGGQHHGLAVPMVCSTHQGGSYRGAEQPVPTIRTRNGAWLAVPVIVPFRGERSGQPPRSHSLHDPFPTIATALGHGLAVPFLANVNHGDTRHSNGRTADVADPIGTVTGHNGRAVVLPFLSSYNGNGHDAAIDAPVPTVVTKDRHSLITALIDPVGTPPSRGGTEAMRQLVRTMRELGVIDIGFRMLANHELAAAQGFPGSYVFHGSKSDVTRQIGNSVSPPVAKAITEALVS